MINSPSPNGCRKTAQSMKSFESLLDLEEPKDLEYFAKKARNLTVQQFGHSLQTFAPLYLSNNCINRCSYCRFDATQDINRKDLSLEDLQKECLALKNQGIDHVLILTGEPGAKLAGLPRLEYLRKAIKIMGKTFSTISFEGFLGSSEEYQAIREAGATGLTVYQETYNPRLYSDYHTAGPKKNFSHRIEVPRLAIEAGFRKITMGVLLGLGPWKEDCMNLYRHLSSLWRRFPEVEFSLSFPRLCPIPNQKIPFPVSDFALVKLIVAFRLSFPRLGITLSTRETADLREHLLYLGITQMSLGSKTTVGGYRLDDFEAKKEPGQFTPKDQRTIEQTQLRVNRLGFQSVATDWELR